MAKMNGGDIKGIRILAFGVVFILCGLSVFASVVSYDLNDDSSLNIQDVQIVANTIIGETSSFNADVNGDSSVDVSDAQIVVNRLIGADVYETKTITATWTYEDSTNISGFKLFLEGNEIADITNPDLREFSTSVQLYYGKNTFAMKAYTNSEQSPYSDPYQVSISH